VYFAISDVAAAHMELSSEGVNVNEVKDDLLSPGSGVKWFNLVDPDGHQVLRYRRKSVSIFLHLIKRPIGLFMKMSC